MSTNQQQALADHEDNGNPWVAKAMRLAMEMSHVYSFVEDDSLPRAKQQLEEHLATCIPLTPAEIQSGSDRVKWAANLIEQLPDTHDGRNSWLLNYGPGVQS